MHDAHERKSLVLIADDEPINLEVLYNTLAGEEDITISIADDGAMALALAEQEEPDLILLDAMMPGIDGYEVCRTLHAKPSTSGIPVIFTTSLTETSRKVEAFKAGAVDYITKPFDRMELLARVRTHLMLRRATRSVIAQNAHLEEQIRERAAAEAALSSLAKELERRTEELRLSNERLSVELAERARANAVSAALQEEIIRAQRERLLELSAPLIPITENILAMPLIGTLDLERAERAVETALLGASQSAAEFVIIDVTGVRSMDGGVASTLARLASGLKLLGRRALLTGIRPEMARTLVRRKVTLEGIVTKATLQSGIRYALDVSNGSNGSNGGGS